MNELWIRLLPFLSADGPRQMAADEVMLDSAVAGLASLRFYSWNPPTVSLGYFQRHEDRLRRQDIAAIPWVRRATGGGAIDHTGDLTYAIALPRSHRQGRSPVEWHDRIHTILAGWLRDHRLGAHVVSGQRAPQASLDYMCFAVPQPGDIVESGKKIVGGAQRLRVGALLQHGSIQVPGLASQGDSIAAALATALGFGVIRSDWSAPERERIDELARTKYSQPSWNCKR